MVETDYRPNSHKSKENESGGSDEKKKIEKIVSGNVTSKKKNEFRKFADIFISEDIQNVKSYIFMDVLIPSIKKAVSDIVTNGIDMILYGGNKPRNKDSRASRVSYSGYYNSEINRGAPSKSSVRSGYSYDDIILDNRGEAEEVLSRMDELISTYGMVSVADLYDLVGITGNYTDNKYGWINIHNASVVRVRDGYLLKLPRALPLD